VKRAAARLLIGLATLLVAASTTHGYVVETDGHGHKLHWQNGTASYYLVSGNNPAGASGEAAIHAAFKTWSDASTNVQYTFAGYTSQGMQAYDGKNIVYWQTGAWPWDQSLAAITWRYFDTSDGKLLDADIVFRRDFNWTVGGSGYDIQNAATHEVGHFGGLGHSTDTKASMYASTHSGETSKRVLVADDLSGLGAIYGGVGSTTTTSSTLAKTDRIGVFRPSTGVWYLDKNGNGAWNDCTTDGCLGGFGGTSDQPVAGHWSGAERSEIGIFRPSAGAWALDPDADGKWDGCSVDGCVNPWGLSGDVGVSGDWGNRGASSVGVFRPSNGYWYLDANGNGQWDGCAIDRCWGPFGLSTDQPVVGDWTGSGVVRIGVFRPSDGTWYLDKNGDGKWGGCSVDLCLGAFGGSGDRAVVGDWTGTGTTKIGVFRPSDGRWYLDLDGKGQWGGCTADACLGPFGIPGDVPVVGKW